MKKIYLSSIVVIVFAAIFALPSVCKATYFDYKNAVLKKPDTIPAISKYVSVYPCPAYGNYINLDCDTSLNGAKVTLYNIAKKQLMTTTLNSSGKATLDLTRINGKPISGSVYVFTIQKKGSTGLAFGGMFVKN